MLVNIVSLTLLLSITHTLAAPVQFLELDPSSTIQTQKYPTNRLRTHPAPHRSGRSYVDSHPASYKSKRGFLSSIANTFTKVVAPITKVIAPIVKFLPSKIAAKITTPISKAVVAPIAKTVETGTKAIIKTGGTSWTKLAMAFAGGAAAMMFLPKLLGGAAAAATGTTQTETAEVCTKLVGTTTTAKFTPEEMENILKMFAEGLSARQKTTYRNELCSLPLTEKEAQILDNALVKAPTMIPNEGTYTASEEDSIFSTYPQLNADEKSQFTQAVLAEPGISQKERNLINKAAAGTLGDYQLEDLD